MRLLAILVYGLLALSASARSLRAWQPDDPVENNRALSANGRFCLVRRDHPTVGDFETVLFKDLVWESSGKTTKTAALYRIDGNRRTLLSTFEIPPLSTSLVADSGEFVAVFPEDADPLLAIFAADGTPVRTLKTSDIFTENDVSSIRLAQLDIVRSIRFDEQLEREIVTVSLPTKTTVHSEDLGEVRIDAATGAVLDAKRDIYPPQRVWASPSESVPVRRDGCEVERDAVRIASKQLFARATKRIVPALPGIARKALIGGDVWAEVVVSESGAVMSVCAWGLPFGFDEAVDEAVRRWTFEPYTIGGRPVRVTSDLVFHFNRVEHAEWNEIVLVYNPPAE